MNYLNQLNYEESADDAKDLYDQIKKKIGMIPNLYKHVAHSPHALKGILSFEDSLNRGTFSKREVQAIDLVTAQENGCQYCLAAHTTIAKKLGFSEEETFQLRTATIDDSTLNALTGLAKEILTTKGYPSDYHIEKFFSAGYDKAALVELIGHISKNIFKNYINHISDTEIDFPKAKKLH